MMTCNETIAVTSTSKKCEEALNIAHFGFRELKSSVFLRNYKQLVEYAAYQDVYIVKFPMKLNAFVYMSLL